MRRQIFAGLTCVTEPKSAMVSIHRCRRAAVAAAPGMKRPRGHGAPPRSLAGGNPGRDRRPCPAPVALCGCICGLGRSSQAHPLRCAPRLPGAPPPIPSRPSTACLIAAGLDVPSLRAGRRRRRPRSCCRRCCAPLWPACRGLPGASTPAPCRPRRCGRPPRPGRPCLPPARRPEHGPCPCPRPHTPAPSAPVRQALGSLPRRDRSPPLPPPRMRRRAATGVRASPRPPFARRAGRRAAARAGITRRHSQPAKMPPECAPESYSCPRLPVQPLPASSPPPAPAVPRMHAGAAPRTACRAADGPLPPGRTRRPLA